MKGAIDLTKLLKMGDEVWSTACGSLVKICYIPRENDYIAYWDDEFMCSICVDIYGYTLPHVLGQYQIWCQLKTIGIGVVLKGISPRILFAWCQMIN